MIGPTFAHYSVSRKIGEGGMGEVYLATDTRLKREVALKVLPPSMAEDGNRLARLAKEAEVLASLDHPNIAQIYGIEEVDGVKALVLQYVAGPTLAQRIAEGVLSPEEATSVALQIAEAMEAAHEQGIVHRDLKPANIKIAPGGTVKVLDFGLARTLFRKSSNRSSDELSALSTAMTQAGMILGTPAYMSPEQAQGKPVDHRADIWSFGCVVYEMLTGHGPFGGETGAEVLGEVLNRQPDLHRLPPAARARFSRLIRRCLKKDPHLRLQHMGDARIELLDEDEPTDLSELSAHRHPGWIAAVALLAGVLLGGAAVWNFFHDSRDLDASSAAFSITTPGWAHSVTISRDGRVVAFLSDATLYTRRLDSLTSRPVTSTEGEAETPFFSPDSRWLGFVSGEHLYKVSTDGGDPIRVTPILEVPGADWGPDDTIVFSNTWTSGLQAVSANGGEVRAVTEPDRTTGEVGHWWPQFLPDGRRVLFTIWNQSGSLNHAQLALVNLDTGRVHRFGEGARPRYSSSGHLLFFRAGHHHVAPFDPEEAQFTGPSRRLSLSIQPEDPAGANLVNFALSDNGTLVFLPGESFPYRSRLVWVDRSGTETELPFPAEAYGGFSLSPDESEIAATVAREGEYDLWLYDLERNTSEQITNQANNLGPEWHPKRRLIAFSSTRTGSFDIYGLDLDRDRQPFEIFSGDRDIGASDWSPDGEQLLVDYWSEKHGTDFQALSIATGQMQSLGKVARAGVHAGVFSPDGRSIAYRSDHTGTYQVYLHELDWPGSSLKLSTRWAWEPEWAHGSNEIFFSGGGQLMVVSVQTVGGRLRVSLPRPLFSTERYFYRHWDVTSDGQRFLLSKLESAPDDLREIRVILNWSDSLGASAQPP